ncbi:hypothetical protein D9Q98_009800 [Chlorella vulgaris]|uniref:Uncharacterized protein n=1 Tax=Chlorella vulgaris TaxID=3077 RepID=A0A9D4YSF5_CHLVU|nr:hypothetical protein D9Q98_009800 [Chlorella vulgaris]
MADDRAAANLVQQVSLHSNHGGNVAHLGGLEVVPLQGSFQRSHNAVVRASANPEYGHQFLKACEEIVKPLLGVSAALAIMAVSLSVKLQEMAVGTLQLQSSHSRDCEDGALTDTVEDLQADSAELRRQQQIQQAAREQTAVQEECNSPATSIEDLKQAPADTAANGARELVLAVLSAPGPLQLTILGHLEQNDKLNLGATYTSLRLASLTWFSELTVEANPDKPDVASLAAWLDRHQVQLSLRLDLSSYKANFAPQLTTLNLSVDLSMLAGSALAPLATLQQIESLDLQACRLKAVPQQLSALTALTHLDLAWNKGLKSGWEHLLPLTELQALCLFACGLTAVPQLSALTALSVRGVRPHPLGPV